MLNQFTHIKATSTQTNVELLNYEIWQNSWWLYKTRPVEVELLVCLTVKINYLCVDIADNSKTFKALLIFFAACERVKHITSLSSGNQLNTGAKLYSSFEKKIRQ